MLNMTWLITVPLSVALSTANRCARPPLIGAGSRGASVREGAAGRALPRHAYKMSDMRLRMDSLPSMCSTWELNTILSTTASAIALSPSLALQPEGANCEHRMRDPLLWRASTISSTSLV